MRSEDKENMPFTIGKAIYYYQRMPFGLKNTKATYQRLMNHIFVDQIGRNTEVYLDNMIAKSKAIRQYLDNLQETFKKPSKRCISGT